VSCPPHLRIHTSSGRMTRGNTTPGSIAMAPSWEPTLPLGISALLKGSLELSN